MYIFDHDQSYTLYKFIQNVFATYEHDVIFLEIIIILICINLFSNQIHQNEMIFYF